MGLNMKLKKVNEEHPCWGEAIIARHTSGDWHMGTWSSDGECLVIESEKHGEIERWEVDDVTHFLSVLDLNDEAEGNNL
jgi:hypothetical protein